MHLTEPMVSAPVLICYDGSDDARRAIGVAAALLVPTAAVVLNVAPPLTPAEQAATSASVVPGAHAFHDLNEAEALQRAREGAERATRAGFRARARGEVAAPISDAIAEVADELDAAVIVIGSRGLSGLREAAQGSVSHAVAVHARRPVLIVPAPRRTTAPREGERPILICYDGSEAAARAIEAAGALLRPRQAVLLDVVPVRVAVGYSPTPSDAPWVDEVDAAAAQGRAHAGAELARRAGFDVTSQVASAESTWRGVTGAADELDASVIVLGSHGLTGLREAVERSVSHDVAAHAHRPVLVAPPSKR
jgi:nucleotide-binding universal stress UspA family protein